MTLIDDVYAQVPEVPCKGLCQRACGPIACSGLEAQALQDAGHTLPAIVDHPTQGPMTCSHLSPEGRCRIYAQRPLVCRLFGAVPEMKCPHGCRPKGGYIGDGKGRALVQSLHDASDLPPHLPY
jgi:Fe-S-cluster containining protein